MNALPFRLAWSQTCDRPLWASNSLWLNDKWWAILSVKPKTYNSYKVIHLVNFYTTCLARKFWPWGEHFSQHPPPGAWGSCGGSLYGLLSQPITINEAVRPTVMSASGHGFQQPSQVADECATGRIQHHGSLHDAHVLFSDRLIFNSKNEFLYFSHSGIKKAPSVSAKCLI